MSTPTVEEKLETMRRDLAELARKLNMDDSSEAALTVQNAIVAVHAISDVIGGYEDLAWDWEPTPES